MSLRTRHPLGPRGFGILLQLKTQLQPDVLFSQRTTIVNMLPIILITKCVFIYPQLVYIFCNTDLLSSSEPPIQPRRVQ